MPEQVQDGYCLAQVTYGDGAQAFSIVDFPRFLEAKAESSADHHLPDISLFCKLTAEQAKAHDEKRLFIFSQRYAHQKPDLLIGESNAVDYCLVSEGRAGEPSVIPMEAYKSRDYHTWRLLTMQEQAAHESGKLNVKKGEKRPLVEIVDE